MQVIIFNANAEWEVVSGASQNMWGAEIIDWTGRCDYCCSTHELIYYSAVNVCLICEHNKVRKCVGQHVVIDCDASVSKILKSLMYFFSCCSCYLQMSKLTQAIVTGRSRTRSIHARCVPDSGWLVLLCRTRGSRSGKCTCRWTSTTSNLWRSWCCFCRTLHLVWCLPNDRNTWAAPAVQVIDDVWPEISDPLILGFLFFWI